jgi:hypothetical protein
VVSPLPLLSSLSGSPAWPPPAVVGVRELLELDELSFFFFFLFSPVVSLRRFFCRRSRLQLDSLLELADRLEPLRDRLRFRLFLFLLPLVRDRPWSRFLRKFCC